MPSKWRDINEEKPEKGVDIKYIDSNGYEGYAFLCTRCGDCWRDTIMGGELMINVKLWRYLNENE